MATEAATSIDTLKTTASDISHVEPKVPGPKRSDYPTKLRDRLRPWNEAAGDLLSAFAGLASVVVALIAVGISVYAMRSNDQATKEIVSVYAKQTELATDLVAAQRQALDAQQQALHLQQIVASKQIELMTPGLSMDVSLSQTHLDPSRRTGSHPNQEVRLTLRNKGAATTIEYVVFECHPNDATSLLPDPLARCSIGGRPQKDGAGSVAARIDTNDSVVVVFSWSDLEAYVELLPIEYLRQSPSVRFVVRVANGDVLSVSSQSDASLRQLRDKLLSKHLARLYALDETTVDHPGYPGFDDELQTDRHAPINK